MEVLEPALLVVPQKSQECVESVVLPLPYSVSPPFTRLTELIQQSAGIPVQKLNQDFFQDLKFAIKGISRLTTADGATIISDQYELLAFGAKL